MNSTILQERAPLILKLPAELLSIIVEGVAECERPCPPAAADEEAEFGPQACYPPWNLVTEGGSLGWIRLTHARHIGCLPDACEEMLRRAGQSTPLDIQLGYNHSLQLSHNMLDEATLDTTFQQFGGRIRSLRIIDVRDNELHAPLPSNLHQLSNMEAVEVHYVDLKHACVEEEYFTSPEACILQTQNLRTARFTNYSIPWTCRSLTHLYLSFEDIGLPYNTLQDTLERVADAIEELELDMAIPKESRHRTPISHTFPRLQYLRVREVGALMATFLQQISFPRTTRLDLTSVPYSPDWNDHFRPVIADAFQRLKDSPSFMAMVVGDIRRKDDATQSNGIRLSFWRDVSSLLSTRSEHASLVLGVEVTGYDNDSEALSLMVTEITDLEDTPWNTILYLDFDFPVWRLNQDSNDLLSLIPHLRQLRLVDPLQDGSLLRGYVPALPAPRSIKRLGDLCVVQTNDSHILPLSRLCDILEARLGSVLYSSEDAQMLGPAVASLRLEIIEKSGFIPHDAEAYITKKFSKFADTFELFLRPFHAQDETGNHTDRGAQAQLTES
ncbi:hypothetical protein PENSPDRAFT_718521 [Peniophora sp. CONT]|nr:hypothetical protein PENSPDRAFT_718521 [Peniophora sp. CONT]